MRERRREAWNVMQKSKAATSQYKKCKHTKRPVFSVVILWRQPHWPLATSKGRKGSIESMMIIPGCLADDHWPSCCGNSSCKYHEQHKISPWKKDNNKVIVVCPVTRSNQKMEPHVHFLTPFYVSL